MVKTNPTTSSPMKTIAPAIGVFASMFGRDNAPSLCVLGTARGKTASDTGNLRGQGGNSARL